MAVSNTMKLAMTFTAVDAASGIVLSLEKKILGIGKAGQQVKRDFENMVGHMRAGIKSLAFSKYLFDSLKPAVRIAADMEEAMSTLEMSMKKSGENAQTFHEQLEKIRETAGKVQLLFPFGQKEFIEAATVLAQSGMSREDIANPKGALYSVGALAHIGKIDTQSAAEITRQVAAIFGVKGAELGKMADWMQKLGTTSALHIGEQGHAVSEGGQMAKSMHMGYKDTLQALAVIAQQSGDASKAGDELQEFLSRLIGVGKKGKEAMEEAGLDFFDKSGKLMPFLNIVERATGLGIEPQDAQKDRKRARRTPSKYIRAQRAASRAVFCRYRRAILPGGREEGGAVVRYR